MQAHEVTRMMVTLFLNSIPMEMHVWREKGIWFCELVDPEDNHIVNGATVEMAIARLVTFIGEG